MNINMTPKTASHAAPLGADIASCLLLFLRSPAKQALMGVWRPVPGVLAEFTSHLESPELGELRLRLPLWNPPHHPPPGPGVPCGSPCPTNTWQINQTHCWQPLTVKAGGWGITWKEWYSWQIFFTAGEKKKYDLEEGFFFFFFFKGKQFAV